jgi:hypothetical protein
MKYHLLKLLHQVEQQSFFVPGQLELASSKIARLGYAPFHTSAQSISFFRKIPAH